MDVEVADDEKESSTRVEDLCQKYNIIIPETVSKVANYDPTGPKLMIHQIENENFKSYAGKQILGPFHKNFTCIVGPNGSGKSNVIDSMLFVFGFRAAKIRSKKISVLIHNSSKHCNINSCTVKVYFYKIQENNPVTSNNFCIDNINKTDENYQIIPNSEFVISRIAFKDNSSYYCINGKKSTFKDVSDLLKSHGIDLDHNRFLILQGEVELISLMKPKAQNENEDGMLEFLEDIIGSNRFKEPLLKLTDIISEQTDKRGEKLSQFKASEKDLETLEGPKNEACYFLEKENEIIRTKNKILQTSKMHLQNTINEHNQKYQDINNKLDQLKSKIQSCLSKKKDIDTQYKTQNKLYETLTSEKGNYQEKIREFEVIDAKVREDLKHNNSKIPGLSKHLEQEKQKILECIETSEKNDEYIVSNKAQLERLKVAKVSADLELQKAFEDLKQNTKDLQKQKEEKEIILLEREKSYIQAKANLERAKGQHKQYLSQYDTKKEKMNDLNKKIKEITINYDETKTKLEELLKYTLPKFETQSSELKMGIVNLKRTEKERSDELREKRMKVDIGKSAMANSNVHRSKLLTALLEAKAQGILPGIHGRLGDLGGIDAKYDAAISSCCGALENIVVDNVNTAQACVTYLKQHKLGSTTFMALSEVGKKWGGPACGPAPRPFPEAVPRLFDLVRPVSPSFAPAFYFALRDTLVARDLEQATRVAYDTAKRHRVVTLAGEVIEVVGTLSGGGGKPIKGRMGTHPVIGKESYARSSKGNEEPDEMTESSIAKLESECDVLLKELETVRTTLLSKENALKALQSSITPALMNQTKWTMDVSSFEVQLQTMKTQLETLARTNEDSVPDASKIKEMEKEIKSLQGIHDEFCSNSETVRKEIEKILQQIKAITDKTVTAQQNKVNSLVETMTKLSREITKMEAEKETCLKNKVKAEIKVENMLKEILRHESIVLECKNKMKELEVLAQDVMDKKDEKTEQLLAMQKDLNTMHALIEKVDKEENVAKSEIVTLTHDFAVQRSILTQNEAELQKITIELRSLKLNVVPLGVSSQKNKEVVQEPAVKELSILSDNELRMIDVEEEKKHIKGLQEEIATLKPNLSIIQDYIKKEKQYIVQAKELDQLTCTRKATQDLFNELKYQRLNEFLSGFTLITVRLKEIYRMITLGGDADLELVDSLDPFTEGVAFKVRPLNKSWKNVNNLSGGEKTLSSIALIFALHHFKPTPFYVMDEIDAALDFKNVSIVANYIKLRTQTAQFIIISLRNNMFELADRLIGIYKTYDCTKNVVFDPKSLYCLEEENDRERQKTPCTLENPVETPDFNICTS